MKAGKRVTNIVFTKNRPMQLHGYLEGLYRFFSPEIVQSRVLYKAELFDAEYKVCFSHFPDCRVVRETDFHSDLLGMIAQTQTPYLLFGIDDVVYFDGVDWSVIEAAFADLGEQLLGFSLRLDRGQMPDDREAANVSERVVEKQTVYTVDWTRGKTKNTRYPFELCATIYRTDDVKRIIAATMKGGDFLHTRLAPGSFLTRLIGAVYSRRKLLKKLGYFFNPNTFESWCCRHIQHHPADHGHLLAFQRICASAIQVNMVNTSTDNEWDDADNLTVEALNARYRQGGRIDIDALAAHKPRHPHADRQHFFVTDGPDR